MHQLHTSLEIYKDNQAYLGLKTKALGYLYVSFQVVTNHHRLFRIASCELACLQEYILVWLLVWLLYTSEQASAKHH
jgi:hypothetical protein